MTCAIALKNVAKRYGATIALSDATFAIEAGATHALLLPSFPGLESQRNALEHGVKFAGCTVHFVDENLDAGPIVQQAVVPVRDEDDELSLSERILKEEHRIYSEAVSIVLQGDYYIEGRRVLRRLAKSKL